jgi:S1-C subfamily serine protease
MPKLARLLALLGGGRSGSGQQVSGPVAVIVIVIAVIAFVVIFSRASLAPKEPPPFILPPEPPLNQNEVMAYAQGLKPLGIIAMMPPLASDRMKGVRVAGVAMGSPAEQAGLRPADLIVSFDHQPVPHAPRLIGMLGRVKVGQAYPIEVMRSGTKVTLTVKGIVPLPPEEMPRG